MSGNVENDECGRHCDLMDQLPSDTRAQSVSSSPNFGDLLKRTVDDRSFRLLFACLPLGLCVVTGNYRIVEANPALTEMLGYGQGELAGKSVHDITHPDDIALTNDYIRRVHSPAGAGQSIVKRYCRKDGGVVYGKVTSLSIRDERDTIIHSFSMIENVTEQRRADELLEQAREAEASRIAEQARLDGALLTIRETVHRVSNALTEAQGYTEIALVRDDLPAETRNLLTLSMHGFANVTSYLQSLQRVVRVTTRPTPIGPALDVGKSVGRDRNEAGWNPEVRS
jgi:PAS domain S-box-containing protein